MVEAVEAVGLWHERRWAEYLTALATAGFLPFEIDELIKRVTVFRVSALVINVAILALAALEETSVRHRRRREDAPTRGDRPRRAVRRSGWLS